MQAQREYEQEESHYNIKFQEFLAVQAGIMARDLEEGKACPVCGSTHHPIKADLKEGAVTQEEVEQAKRARNQAEEKRSKATQAAVRVVEAFQLLRGLLEEEEVKWLGASYPQEQLKLRLYHEKKEISSLLKEAEKEEEEALAADHLLKKILEERKADRSRREELELEKEKSREDWQQKQVSMAALLAETDHVKKRLPYP